MADIKLTEWVNNPNRLFKQGVDLYRKYGGNKTLLSLFERKGEGSFTRVKLLEELIPIEKKINTVRSSSAPAVRAATTVAVQKMPDSLNLKMKEKGELYARANQLHARLPLLRDNSERLEAALELMDLFDRISAIWKEYDLWRGTGIVLKDKQPKKITAVDLAVQLENCKNAIRRYRKSKRADMVEKWQEKKKLIETQLKHAVRPE